MNDIGWPAADRLRERGNAAAKIAALKLVLLAAVARFAAIGATIKRVFGGNPTPIYVQCPDTVL